MRATGKTVQVFGTRKSSETRAALRFFAERRIAVHFVDLTQRAASQGELRRFVDRFGVMNLVDKNSGRFKALGLNSASYSETRWFELLLAEPLLLRQPLLRYGTRIAIGLAPEDWKGWLAE